MPFQTLKSKHYRSPNWTLSVATDTCKQWRLQSICSNTYQTYILDTNFRYYWKLHKFWNPCVNSKLLQEINHAMQILCLANLTSWTMKLNSAISKFTRMKFRIVRLSPRQICTQISTRTRWRRVKTLGQHQVGVNLQSHAQHQLWISTWHIFSWIPQNNARLKLSCKFGESKCNPC